MVLILLYNGYESESKLRKYNECAWKTGKWMLAVGAHTVTCVSLSHHSLSPDVQVAFINVASALDMAQLIHSKLLSTHSVPTSHLLQIKKTLLRTMGLEAIRIEKFILFNFTFKVSNFITAVYFELLYPIYFSIILEKRGMVHFPFNFPQSVRGVGALCLAKPRNSCDCHKYVLCTL